MARRLSGNDQRVRREECIEQGRVLLRRLTAVVRKGYLGPKYRVILGEGISLL